MFRAADNSTPIHRKAIAQLPEAGAVCSNSASTDLCGGRRVTVVPTATNPIRRRHRAHKENCVANPLDEVEFTREGRARWAAL
jgi:hypothetical protein